MFGELTVKATQYEPAAQMDDPGVIAGLEYVDTIERTKANGDPASVPTALVFRFPSQTLDAALAAKGKAPTVFGRPDGLLGFVDIDGIDLDADADQSDAPGTEAIVAQRICSGEVRLTWNDACAEAGVVPDAIVVSDTVRRCAQARGTVGVRR